MFCPRCAAQNLDDAKFCRACGTNLETVALALSDKYRPARKDKDEDRDLDPIERWLQMRKKNVNKLARGIGLLVSSLLIGAALGLFSHTPDWVIIWMCMVGWMACLGIISIVSGTAGVMEARFLRRQLGQLPGAAISPGQLLPNDALTMPILTPQSSVTEHTTTRLIKPEPTSKQAS